jgi:CheY-like chemotaxis protein
MSVGLPSDSPLDSSAPLSLEGAGVLIVDEDPAFQLGLKTFLKEYVGFSSVHVAKNGREALRILREEPGIDLVTLDYRMPELDGLGVLDRLRDDPPRPLAVVMITGYPSERLEEEFHAYHSPMLRTEYFVAKPIDFGALEPVVLRAYESLKAATPVVEPPLGAGSESPVLHAAVAEALGPVAPVVVPDLSPVLAAMTERLEAMAQKLASMETQLAGVAGRTPSLMGRFWLGALGWIFAAAFAFLAYQMGWFAEAGAWIEQTLLVAPPDGGGE